MILQVTKIRLKELISNNNIVYLAYSHLVLMNVGYKFPYQLIDHIHHSTLHEFIVLNK